LKLERFLVHNCTWCENMERISDLVEQCALSAGNRSQVLHVGLGLTNTTDHHNISASMCRFSNKKYNSNVFQFPGYVRDSVVVAVVLHTNRIKIPKNIIISLKLCLLVCSTIVLEEGNYAM